MLIVSGRTYCTITDAAEKFGVSAKTVRSYIAKGIIPDPPTVNYGVRTIRHFPPEYVERAKDILKKYAAPRKSA
jgi:DNA-binding transcriptional MerR regulator